MSLHKFNPGEKSWKMYVNELTSISGDDLTIKPYEYKDLILEVSGNNQIIFKQGDVSYNLANLSSGGGGGGGGGGSGIQNNSDASLNNLEISGSIINNSTLNIMSNNITFKPIESSTNTQPETILSGLVSNPQVISGTSQTWFGVEVKISNDSKYIFVTSRRTSGLAIYKNNGTLTDPSYDSLTDLAIPSYAISNGWGNRINCNNDASILILSFFKSNSASSGYAIFYRNTNSDTFTAVNGNPFINPGSAVTDWPFTQNNFLSNNGNYFIFGDPFNTQMVGFLKLFEVTNTGADISLNLLTTITGSNTNEMFAQDCEVSDDGYIVVGARMGNDNYKGRIYIYKYDATNNSYSEVWRFDNPSEYITSNPSDNLGARVSISSNGYYVAFAASMQDNPESAANNRGWIRVYKRSANDNTSWDQVGNEMRGILQADGGGSGRFEGLGHTHLIVKDLSSGLVVFTSYHQNNTITYVGGAAYLYGYKENSDTSWNLLTKVLPTSNYQWALGYGLSMSNNVTVTGLPGDTANANLGSNSNQIKIHTLNIQNDPSSNSNSNSSSSSTSVNIEGSFLTNSLSTALINGISGELIITNDIVPDISNTYDLGSADKPFRDIFVSDIDTDGNILLSTFGNSIKMDSGTQNGPVELYLENRDNVNPGIRMKATYARMRDNNGGDTSVFDANRLTARGVEAYTFKPTYEGVPDLTGKIGQTVSAANVSVTLVVNVLTQVRSLTIPSNGVWLISFAIFLGNASTVSGPRLPTSVRINNNTTQNFYGTLITGTQGTIVRTLSNNDVVTIKTYLTGTNANTLSASQRGVYGSAYTFLTATRIA